MRRSVRYPLDRWFREDLAAMVDDAHARGFASHGHALWTLLTLEWFLRGS